MYMHSNHSQQSLLFNGFQLKKYKFKINPNCYVYLLISLWSYLFRVAAASLCGEFILGKFPLNAQLSDSWATIDTHRLTGVYLLACLYLRVYVRVCVPISGAYGVYFIIVARRFCAALMAARIPQQWLINKSYKYASLKENRNIFQLKHTIFVCVRLCACVWLCVHTYEYSHN